MRYRLSARARKDMREIWDYVATRSGSASIATRLLQRLGDRISLVAQNPLAGRKRPDLEAGLRLFSHENYVILYRVTKHVEILRIVQGNRDLSKLILD